MINGGTLEDYATCDCNLQPEKRSFVLQFAMAITLALIAAKPSSAV